MKDYPSHNVHVLGGGFGMRLNDLNRELMSDTFDEMLNASDGKRYYGRDQQVLRDFYWAKTAKETVAYDSFYCH